MKNRKGIHKKLIIVKPKDRNAIPFKIKQKMQFFDKLKCRVVIKEGWRGRGKLKPPQFSQYFY